MNVHAIFGTDDEEDLESAVRHVFPEEDRYEICSGDWIVASQMTTQEIGERLMDHLTRDSDGDVETSFLVVPLSSTALWGYHEANLWEWIETRRKAR